MVLFFTSIIDINTKIRSAENIKNIKAAVQNKECESFENQDFLMQLGELQVANFMIASLL